MLRVSSFSFLFFFITTLNSLGQIYSTITNDNAIVPYSVKYSNAQAQLIFPYSLDNSKTSVYNHTATVTKSKHPFGINIGLLSLEIGKVKSLYGRIETGLTILNGKGPPSSIRIALGYNIKFLKHDKIILRPELGCTYISRQVQLPYLDFGSSYNVYIMGKDFKFGHPTGLHSSNESNGILINFCENILNFSPSLGVSIHPFLKLPGHTFRSDLLILRLNVGYNYSFYESYSVHFSANGTSLREKENHINLSFSNTNGQANHLFKYDGIFAKASIGILIKSRTKK